MALPATSILRAISKEGMSFLTRVVGPVADVSDLLSDKIRFYRWQAAVKTISRATEIAERAGLEPEQIPLKFLVPFLETCSLEDGNSELSEAWARLLVSASQGTLPEHFIFLDVLRKMSATAAKVFQSFPIPEWGDAETYLSVFGTEAPAMDDKLFDSLHRVVRTRMRKGASPDKIIEAVSEKFQKQCTKCGCVLGRVDAEMTFRGKTILDGARFGSTVVENPSEYALLKHLGLIANKEYRSPVVIAGEDGNDEEAGVWYFSWVQLTVLGAKLKRCIAQPR